MLIWYVPFSEGGKLMLPWMLPVQDKATIPLPTAWLDEHPLTVSESAVTATEAATDARLIAAAMASETMSAVNLIERMTFGLCFPTEACQLAEVKPLLAEGLGKAEIARRLGIARVSIYNMLAERQP